jgi:hypothetical protein
MLRLGGWIAQSLLGDPLYLNDSAITPRLRILCSVYPFISWIIIAVILSFIRSVPAGWRYSILFAAAMSPLAIKTSVLLQIDNTVGPILCGTAAILILLATEMAASRRWQVVLLWVAGVIAGLGKQEWSMALAAALAVLFFLLWMARSFESMQYCGIIFAGLLTGNAISYLFDMTNYMNAFKFMPVFSGLTDPEPQRWQLERWWSLMKLKAPFIYICFALQGISVLSIFTNRKQKPLKYLLFLYGSILFFSYFVINWNLESRYFVPSLAVLAVSCIGMLPPVLPSWHKTITVVLIVAVFISTVVFVFFNTTNSNIQLDRVQSGQLKTSQDTALFLDSGAGWNKPQINYINNNSGYETVREKVMENFGKKLVLP